MTSRTTAPRRGRAKSRASNRKLDNLMRQFRKQPAQISKDEMYMLEKRAQQDGINRRLMFGALSMSGDEIIAAVNESDDSAETMATMMVCVEDYEKKARQLAEWARTATCRLAMGLAYREDMQQLLAAAKKRCEMWPTTPDLQP